MEIRVSGHGVDTGDAFRTHVAERLNAITTRYFDRAISAHVVLKNGPHNSFDCDVLMHVRQGLILKGSNRAGTAQQALDGAAARIDKQLRRYMRRLKDRTGAPGLSSLPVASVEIPADARYQILAGGDMEEEAPDVPLTIAETQADIPEASVSDAVMMLDLRNTTALMFRNVGTGAYNMVYRREDGNIGWVEPRT